MNEIDKLYRNLRSLFKTKFFNFKVFQYLLSILGIGIIIFFANKNWDELTEVIDNLKNANLYYLPLLIPLRFYNYWVKGEIYAKAISVLDVKISPKEIYRPITAMSFLNAVIPAGGLSGLAYLSNNIKSFFGSKSLSERTSIISLAHAISIFANFIGLTVVLGFGFIDLLLLGQEFSLNQRFILLFIWFLISIIMLIIVFLTNPRVISWISWHAIRPVNFILGFILPDKVMNEVRWHNFINALHLKLRTVLNRPRAIVFIISRAIIFVSIDIATAKVISLGLNLKVSLGVIAVAYFFSYISEMLGFMTNGIGVAEVAMTAALRSLGVDFADALSLAIIYRFITYFAFLPFGWLTYHYSNLGKKSRANP